MTYYTKDWRLISSSRKEKERKETFISHPRIQSNLTKILIKILLHKRTDSYLLKTWKIERKNYN